MTPPAAQKPWQPDTPTPATARTARRIAVIGAGVIGVTTAYELAADGNQVTVFERRGSVAEEASFANAGLVAPGYVTPWAGPGMRGKVLKNLWAEHASVKVRWPLAAADLVWMWKWQRACKTETYAANRARMQRLAFYSRNRLHTLSEKLALSYDQAQGYLVLLRSERERRQSATGLAALRDAGVVFHELDATAARLVEPALNPDTAFAGAIHLPQDEVANCRQFTQLLRDQAIALGVEFQYRTSVSAIVKNQRGHYTSLVVTNEPDSTMSRPGSANPPATLDFDAVVVCAGAQSHELLQPHGIKLPLRPIYGYSISAHLREPPSGLPNAPISAVMDERYKVAISRIGQRVRVAGSAEIGGELGRIGRAPIATLYKVLHDWFPGAAHMRHVQEWKGARPMLPDGPPVIGNSSRAGLWLNLGHGSSGWALSCGSARVLADTLAGRAPEIDASGLGIERLGLRP